MSMLHSHVTWLRGNTSNELSVLVSSEQVSFQ